MLRYKDEVFDSEEHKAGTGYRVDLLKLEQMNIQSKYSRPIWRRSVAPTPTPPGQRSRPTSAASQLLAMKNECKVIIIFNTIGQLALPVLHMHVYCMCVYMCMYAHIVMPLQCFLTSNFLSKAQRKLSLWRVLSLGVPSTAIQGLNVNASAAQGEGGSGPSHPAGPTSRHVAVDAAATVMVFKGRKSALSSAKQALQSMITVTLCCNLVFCSVSHVMILVVASNGNMSALLA